MTSSFVGHAARVPAQPSHAGRVRHALLACCAALLAGCGGSDYDLVPVSGRVTQRGQPLSGVHVSFQPRNLSPSELNAGPGSFGTTDSNGRFTLETVDGGDSGAVPGKHQVRLTTPPPASDEDLPPPAQDPIPAKYRNGTLEFTVPRDGTDQANFEL